MSNCSTIRGCLGLQEHNKHNHNNNSRERQQQSRRQPTHFASCDCVMGWADEEWERRRGGVGAGVREQCDGIQPFTHSPISREERSATVSLCCCCCWCRVITPLAAALQLQLWLPAACCCCCCCMPQRGISNINKCNNKCIAPKIISNSAHD